MGALPDLKPARTPPEIGSLVRSGLLTRIEAKALL
jgi:hypothetical protein